jgi:NAD(P)-dependent dehydrogenase (short-subunit alcohol dehydrogenase family)
MAEYFAALGAIVVVHGRSRERLWGVIEELERSGGEWMAVTGDVREPADVEQAVREIHQRFGKLDALIANVGAAYPGPADQLEPDKWSNAFRVNLDSAFYCAQAARPMLAEQRGSVVLLSATAATSATPNFAAYGAAKAAIQHLTGTLAAEWGPHVRVNCVAPGIVLTEGSAKALFGGDDEKIGRAGSTTAVGRVGFPDDIAHACHFLISAAAGYVNGHVLVVDGGPVEGPADRIMRAVRKR